MNPDPSATHPELVAGLKECIEEWMTLNTDVRLREPEELAARVLVWLAEREWCECPAFPGIVRERDLLDARLAEATASHVRVVEFLKRLRADLMDDADMIENGYGMISAAWVASHMRHIARYGHRMPRKGERSHIHHDGEAAILNATSPTESPIVAAGTTEPAPKPCTFHQHMGCIGSCVGRYCYANDGNLWTAADEGAVPDTNQEHS